MKNKYLVFAILFSAFITWICFERFYPSEGIPGMLYTISLFAQFTFLIIGPILFVFRISGFLKRDKFIYIFAGVGNIWLSLISFLLFFLGRVEALMIWAFLPNLLVGALLLIDTYWKRASPENTKAL